MPAHAMYQPSLHCWQLANASRRRSGDDPAAGNVRARPTGLGASPPTEKRYQYDRSASRPPTSTLAVQSAAGPTGATPCATTCDMSGTSESCQSTDDDPG